MENLVKFWRELNKALVEKTRTHFGLIVYSDFHIINSGSSNILGSTHRWLSIYIPIIQQSASSPADLHLLVVALIMAMPRVINKVPNSAFSEKARTDESYSYIVFFLADK